MKKIDFTQPGGFPLEQNTLAFMQDATEDLLHSFLQFVSNPTTFEGVARQQLLILFGVEPDGNQVTPGWIIRDSELLYFAGDSLSNIETAGGIGVHTATTPATFRDNSVHNVYVEKTAIAGGTRPQPLSMYRRIVNLSDLRPIARLRLRRATPRIAPGSFITVRFSISQAKLGDVAVVQVLPIEGGGVSTTTDSRIVTHPAVIDDGVLEVTLMNRDITQSIPGGEKDFHIRIIK